MFFIQFQNTPNFRANSFRIFLWKYIHPWLGYPKPEDSSYYANLTFHKVGLSKQHRVQKYVSVHKWEPQDPSKLQPRSVTILSPCQESRLSRERGSQKGTLVQNTAKIDSAAAKKWNLKIRCQEFIVSTWNLPEERTAALPLLPPLPPKPRCRESVVKREQKRDVPWKNAFVHRLLSLLSPPGIKTDARFNPSPNLRSSKMLRGMLVLPKLKQSLFRIWRENLVFQVRWALNINRFLPSLVSQGDSLA